MKEHQKQRKAFETLKTKYLTIVEKNNGEENIDIKKLPPGDIRAVMKMKIRDVTLKLPSAKKDLIPLYELKSLADCCVMSEEEFILLKMNRCDFDFCVNECQ